MGYLGNCVLAEAIFLPAHRYCPLGKGSLKNVRKLVTEKPFRDG